MLKRTVFALLCVGSVTSQDDFGEVRASLETFAGAHLLPSRLRQKHNPGFVCRAADSTDPPSENVLATSSSTFFFNCACRAHPR